MPGGRKSDRVRERAVLALLSCPTVAAAAAEAGVSERTLWGWMRDDPEFRGQYSRARAEAVDDGLRQLQRGAAIAARALIRQARGEDAGASIKAAIGLLDQLAKATRAADVQAVEDRLGLAEARLAEVESRLAAREKPDDAHGRNGRKAGRPSG
jgi:hypothetical protein